MRNGLRESKIFVSLYLIEIRSQMNRLKKRRVSKLRMKIRNKKIFKKKKMKTNILMIGKEPKDRAHRNQVIQRKRRMKIMMTMMMVQMEVL